MKTLRSILSGLGLMLLSTCLYGQQLPGSAGIKNIRITDPSFYRNIKRPPLFADVRQVLYGPGRYQVSIISLNTETGSGVQYPVVPSLSGTQSPHALRDHSIDLSLYTENDFFLNNRRNRYSALWAFASLNYLYADLAGLMDQHLLTQYQQGVVDGTRITPGFLTIAAAFMQVPLSNVFLPQVIKNERTLRWVQIASGTLMTLVQSGTLFVGKPTPYYVLFSAVEIGTTFYITLDAIKWKTSGQRDH